MTETVEILAEHAPSLHEALRELRPEGFVVLDGTLIATDRITADEPYYSVKHRRHGMNVQVVASPDGTPLWFSRALPGHRDHARLRAPGERAFARLKQWRIFRKARCSTNRISQTIAAVHANETAWRSG